MPTFVLPTEEHPQAAQDTSTSQDQASYQSPEESYARLRSTASFRARVSQLTLPPGSTRALTRTRDTIANWTASFILTCLIGFTTCLNFVYVVNFHNQVRVRYPSIYAATQEWLFGSSHTGELDPTIVYNFMNAVNDTTSVSELTATFKKPPKIPVSDQSACFAQLGQDGGSIYALCDRLDPARLPSWASSFESLTVQTIRLSSISEFLNNDGKSVPAVLQAYKNERNGWYKQDTAQRLHCTTPQIASAAPATEPRVIYTTLRGVLRNVDCSESSEQNNAACRAVKAKGSTKVVLFDDHSSNQPFILPYEVFRDAKGEYVILAPYLSLTKISVTARSEDMWPVDNCLYLRDGSIGWFGIGLTTYTVQIPTIALIAKIQLIALIFVIWLVKYGCKPSSVHHAFFQASRLGYFFVLVVQMMVSAYYEQDILRAIYAWTRRDVNDWMLMLYVQSSITVSTSLMALALVRVIFESSIAPVGCWLLIIMSMPLVLVELGVAQLRYSRYSRENGLQAEPMACEPPFTGCAPAKFNSLLLVQFLVVVPAIAEFFLFLRRKRKGKGVVYRKDEQQAKLTSFEKFCLDGERTTDIVWDAKLAHISNGLVQTPPEVITASGFTIIDNRFAFRTEDSAFVLAAAILPRPLLRDFSIIVWPLYAQADGVLAVTSAQRVFLWRMRFVQLREDGQSSLLRSAEHPLA